MSELTLWAGADTKLDFGPLTRTDPFTGVVTPINLTDLGTSLLFRVMTPAGPLDKTWTAPSTGVGISVVLAAPNQNEGTVEIDAADLASLASGHRLEWEFTLTELGTPSVLGHGWAKVVRPVG
jgi:hypothetical protein